MGEAEKQKVLQWIDCNKEEIVRIASDMIKIPSISGRPDSAKYYREASDYLVNEFNKFGIQGEAVANSTNGSGPNTIATLKGSGGGRTLAMGGHYDVVAAEEPDWKTEGGFVPVIKDGNLIGRGAADMKGGLACCLVAMKALKECGVSLKGDIQFVATIDEEIGGPDGMGYLAEQGKVLPDFFINAEQTEMEIIIAYKGCFWAEVVVSGVTAHSSKPELGINAVEKAAELICAFRKRGLKWEKDDFLGECTVNYGTIAGGTLANVVPDECKIAIDVRLVPGQTYDGALAEFQTVIDEMMANDPQFKASIKFCSRCTNAVRIPTDSDLVKTLKANTGVVTGTLGKLNSFIAAGDNCIFHRRGIPALMMGPGSLKYIHKSNEWVSIQDLINTAKIYALTAIDLCQ